MELADIFDEVYDCMRSGSALQRRLIEIQGGKADGSLEQLVDGDTSGDTSANNMVSLEVLLESALEDMEALATAAGFAEFNSE